MLTRRDFLKIGGAALLSSTVPGYLTAAAAIADPPVLYHGSSFYPRISITYDDCQLLSRLRMLQAALADNPNVRVTLFAVGQALVNNEAKEAGIWKWFYSRGHEFAYHSWDHTNPFVLSDEDVLADYDRWQDALYSVLGDQPLVRFCRPPYGNLSSSFLNMCRRRGKVPTMWSTGFGGSIANGIELAKQARNGDIALMHTRNQPADPAINQEESWDMTITSQILPYFTENGIQCVTVGQLYDDLLREQQDSPGCEIGAGASLTRSCLDYSPQTGSVPRDRPVAPPTAKSMPSLQLGLSAIASYPQSAWRIDLQTRPVGRQCARTARSPET
ncbi:MAG: polysaccharide deacetylase family protein [Anaerolineales bacterium]